MAGHNCDFKNRRNDSASQPHVMHCSPSETFICGLYENWLLVCLFSFVLCLHVSPKSRNTSCGRVSAALGGGEILLVQAHILTAFDVIVHYCLVLSRLLCFVFFQDCPSKDKRRAFLPPSYYFCCVAAYVCFSPGRADRFQGKRWDGLARTSG